MLSSNFAISRAVISFEIHVLHGREMTYRLELNIILFGADSDSVWRFFLI